MQAHVREWVKVRLAGCAQGMIPAAVYGEGGDAVAVAVSAKDIATILRSGSGHNTIFKLALPKTDGEPENVIIKDYQVDPVKGRLLHADLLRLSMTTLTRVSVSVETSASPRVSRAKAGYSSFSFARSRSSVCRATYRST